MSKKEEIAKQRIEEGVDMARNQDPFAFVISKNSNKYKKLPIK